MIVIQNSFKKIVAVFGIVVWMALHAWLIAEWFGFDLVLAVWDSAVTTMALVTLGLVISNVLLHYMPEVGKFWYAFILSLVLSWLCQWAVQEALVRLATDDLVYLKFIAQSMPIRWAFDFIVIVSVSISSLIYYQWREHEEIAQQKAATLAMAKEAELQKLQLQLQPHFLFNCLNSINALILVNASQARKMVQQLSDFLRTTIKRADEHWIDLAGEWAYLQLYLEIEKVRFGHRLDVQCNFQEEIFNWKIPTLLLQPLVENAIKFGLYGTTDKVTITIEGAVEGAMLKIKITNPFDSEMSPPRGSGFGLNGMQRRLYLLFARNDLLDTHVNENVFTVILKLPKQND